MMKLFKKLLPLAALFIAACGSNVGEKTTEGLDVVTTFYPVYNFAQEVVGDNGKVTALLQAGQDTHSYEPTPKDMAAIAEADVFVYSSEYMETWIPAVLDTLADSDVKVVNASEGISFYGTEDSADHEHEEEHDDHEEEQDHHEDDGHDHVVDPHIWLDPVSAKKMVETISEEIQTVDEEHAESYQANTAEYLSELDLLNQEFESAFEQSENRVFVVQHAAFGYLARRYELEEVSISALTSNQEVSPAKLAEIGAFVKENDIAVIYYQDSGNNELAATIANETGIELGVLSAIEGVTAEDQANGLDYLAIMRDNLKALKQTIN